jgi:hypothetical protein
MRQQLKDNNGRGGARARGLKFPTSGCLRVRPVMTLGFSPRFGSESQPTVPFTAPLWNESTSTSLEQRRAGEPDTANELERGARCSLGHEDRVGNVLQRGCNPVEPSSPMLRRGLV